MKKTFPVNINGSIFYIDEDAYSLLSTYLDQLHTAFPGQEGKEIVDDIESRIAELFNECIRTGARVIVLDNVNSVIEQMGRPADLRDNVADEAGDSQTNDADGATPPPYTPLTETGTNGKRLYRSETDKVFGGVFGGLAIYLGWNAQVMRILYSILACCTYFWPLTIIYLIAWMVIPVARTPRQKLEMIGQPVTVGNVGQTILGTAEPEPNATNSFGKFVNTCLEILGKFVMGLLGLISLAIAIGMIVLLVTALCGLVTYWGWNEVEILNNLHGPGVLYYHPIITGCFFVCLSLAVLIPFAGLIWGACVSLFRIKGASRPMVITMIVVEILLIVACALCFSISSVSNTTFAVSCITSFSALQLC